MLFAGGPLVNLSRKSIADAAVNKIRKRSKSLQHDISLPQKSINWALETPTKNDELILYRARLPILKEMQNKICP